MVQPKRKLSWLPSGPRLWALVLVSVFVLFLIVYEGAVEDDQREANFEALPNSRIVLSPITTQIADVPPPPSLDVLAPAPRAAKREGEKSSLVDQVTQSVPKPRMVEHQIKSGDTLEGIFQNYGFPIGTLYSILEADQEYLVLEPLQVGDRLRFETNEKDELVRISRRIDPSKTIAYVQDKGGFVYKEELKPISWSQFTKHGTVDGSFYLSAKRAGLSDANVMTVSDLLKGRLDFRRDIRAGDAFDVVLKQGDVNGETVGSEQVEAVRIQVRGQYYQAFLNSSDGRFYDENGNSLTPALRRLPTAASYRVSSGFNPNRMHPVTGRPAPHNGTDLATPNGTQVLATGDGVVTRTADHRYAGKYIDIDNIGKYSTRFLHLSKILVKQGQRVKRGQVIALSGSTGRVTGPHLHYELHIGGKPVNPMTAKIPTMSSIPKAERGEFDKSIAAWTAMMNAKEML